MSIVTSVRLSFLWCYTSMSLNFCCPCLRLLPIRTTRTLTLLSSLVPVACPDIAHRDLHRAWGLTAMTVYQAYDDSDALNHAVVMYNHLSVYQIQAANISAGFSSAVNNSIPSTCNNGSIRVFFYALALTHTDIKTIQLLCWEVFSRCVALLHNKDIVLIDVYRQVSVGTNPHSHCPRGGPYRY